MKCPKCGSDKPLDSNHCADCGHSIFPEERGSISLTQTLNPLEEESSADLFAGRYRILEELGRGGMGIVLKAVDIKLKRTVALKFLPKELTQSKQARERFIREAQTAAALDHPNICTVYEVDEADGKTFISMAYVAGQSLRKKVDQGSFPLSTVLDIALQVVEGLDGAHRKGIVHRDIKSANIMLDERNRIKIMDFGLAKLSGVSKFTRTGTTMGTLAYMSPEQAKGKDTDHRTDIFSFGVVLYEMITGQLPFEGDSEASILHSLLYEDPDPLQIHIQDIPEEWQWVIEKAPSKDLGTRYQTTEELFSDLNSLKAGLVGAEETAPIQRIKRRRFSSFTTFPMKYWTRASPKQRLGIGSVLVLLILAAFIFWPFSVGIVPLARGASLVVLPSQVYGSPEVGLGDAIPSTLTALLNEEVGLDTVVPPKSFELEKFGWDWAQTGKEYGVKMCVLSTFTVEPTRNILSIQLGDPKTKKVLWSRIYETKQSSYVEPLREAANGILLKIFPETSSPVSGIELAGSAEAEQSLRLGQHFSARFNNHHIPEDFDRALSEFKKALELDEKLADAAAEIAILYQFKKESGGSWKEVNIEMRRWADRALEINPECSKAWVASAIIEFGKFRPDLSLFLELGLKSVFFDPRDSMGHLTLYHAFYRNSWYLAMASVEEAHRTDRFYLYPTVYLAGNNLRKGNYALALSYIDEALQIEPDMLEAMWTKGCILAAMNRKKEADQIVKALESAKKEGRFSEHMLVAFKVWILLHSRDPKEVTSAHATLREKIEDPSWSRVVLGHVITFIPQLLVKQRQKELALKILEYGEKRKFNQFDYMVLAPEYKSLRGDKRFDELLVIAKTRFDQMLMDLKAARDRGEFPEYLEKSLADLLNRLGIERNL